MDLYHALNRGVDKRTLFLDNQDYARFVHDMYIFNSTAPANNTRRDSMVDFVSRPYTNEEGALVDIHGWCLMKNHYHLLLSERVEGGLVLFLRKLNVGYAKYFNERYVRTGTLFQGRTKKILINTDAHFLHILNYIHLNPLDFMDGGSSWRAGKIASHEMALDYLQKYRWSSYQDYVGIKNFPSVLTTSLFQDVFENDYKNSLTKYLKSIDFSETSHLLLEKQSDY